VKLYLALRAKALARSLFSGLPVQQETTWPRTALRSMPTSSVGL
jgi:hypothetical protein